jgi:hypothetical protein
VYSQLLGGTYTRNSTILRYGSKLGDSFTTGQAQADGFTLPYANFANDFGGESTVAQALSPYPQYVNIVNEFEGSGTVFYNGLRAEAEKRYTNGLAFLRRPPCTYHIEY